LIYCYYPEKKSSAPLIKLDQGWKCIYPGDLDLNLPAAIEQEAGKSRKNIVVGMFDESSPIIRLSIIACGSADFTESIREKVLRIMSKTNIINFVEVEYRPDARETREIELESAELQLRNRKVIQRKSIGRLARLRRNTSQTELVPLPDSVLENGGGLPPGLPKDTVSRHYDRPVDPAIFL
jgi:hypothetical protein